MAKANPFSGRAISGGPSTRLAKSPVPVRSVDHPTRRKSLSFVLDNGTKADTTDPMTTITEAELKDLI